MATIYRDPFNDGLPAVLKLSDEKIAELRAAFEATYFGSSQTMPPPIINREGHIALDYTALKAELHTLRGELALLREELRQLRELICPGCGPSPLASLGKLVDQHEAMNAAAIKHFTNGVPDGSPPLKAASTVFKPVDLVHGKIEYRCVCCGEEVTDCPHECPSDRRANEEIVAGIKKAEAARNLPPHQIVIRWKCGCCMKVPYGFLPRQSIFNTDAKTLDKCDMSNGCFCNEAAAYDFLLNGNSVTAAEKEGVVGDMRWSVE